VGETDRRRHFGNISWKAAVLETATDLGNKNCYKYHGKCVVAD
jgi:hypothetical protein